MTSKRAPSLGYLLVLPTLASLFISAATLPFAISRFYSELHVHTEDSSSLGILFSLIYLVSTLLVFIAATSVTGWFLWKFFQKRDRLI